MALLRMRLVCVCSCKAASCAEIMQEPQVFHRRRTKSNLTNIIDERLCVVNPELNDRDETVDPFEDLVCANMLDVHEQEKLNEKAERCVLFHPLIFSLCLRAFINRLTDSEAVTQ